MKTITKILITEHDLTDLELLQYELEKAGINYIPEIVQDEKGYRHALNNFIPDIILSDYTFPSFSGPAAFKIRNEMAPDTPFIFVSGTIGEENSIEYIKNGVTDYALKDKLFTLAIKVKRALKEAEEKRQKKKTEEELVQSERRLARAQQVAHMGSWELNFTTHEVRWSDETCRIYGLTLDQNLQTFESWLSFTHPEDLDFVLQKIKEAQKSLGNFSFYFRIILRNGFVRHIYSESRVELDSNGKPVGLYGIAHDLTEQVLLENKLVQERHQRKREITAAVLTAQENERAEIGKELHDNLNQVLAVAKLYVQMATTYEKDRAMYLEKACSFIEEVIVEIRRISKKLVIPGMHLIGLFDNIKNLLNDLIMVHPIKIDFHEEAINEKDLNEKLQLTIFRIVQEQVNNILKHANATHASITLRRQANEVVLLISDNGEGSDILKEINGVGLINIKSRTELYHGNVTIATKPGEGYELKVVLPLEDHKLN